jgi:protein phosphatase
MAVDSIPHSFSQYGELPMHEALQRAVMDANTEIHKRGQANEEFHNMGTTCSTLLLTPQGAIVAHVGDSRVYRLRQSRLEQLTFDHSLVWEMRKSGQLSAEEMSLGRIPKNVITRSLGPYADSKVDMEGPFPIMVNDKFLLCSDGLTGLVEDSELASLIGNLPPNEAVRALVDLANLRGGPDNITCIIVEIKHPQLATVSEGGSNPRGSRPRKSTVHPLTIAVLAGSAITAAAFFFFNPGPAAIIPAAIFLATLVWFFVQLYQGLDGVSSATHGAALGNGPYVQVKGASGPELAGQLKEMAQQIVEFAEKQNWEIDISAFHKLQSSSEKAQGADAVRAYARCVSFLMDQLRKQP